MVSLSSTIELVASLTSPYINKTERSIDAIHWCPLHFNYRFYKNFFWHIWTYDGSIQGSFSGPLMTSMILHPTKFQKLLRNHCQRPDLSDRHKAKFRSREDPLNHFPKSELASNDLHGTPPHQVSKVTAQPLSASRPLRQTLGQP